MFVHKHTRLLLSALVAVIAGLSGCGSGSSVAGRGPGLGDGSNNALLQGQYAFSLTGQDSNGPFFAVGSFTADGQGHLGGNEDVNSNSLPTGPNGARFSGSYSVGGDGRGNVVIGIQPGCPNWQLTMVNQGHALLTCVNTNITGSGSIDLQNPGAFSMGSLKGNYVFNLAGLGFSSGLAVMAGAFSMDGAGNIAAGRTDVNDLGTVSQNLALSGTYTVSSNGRGTATLASQYGNPAQNFVFYIVNANDFKMLELDRAPVVSGEVLTQAPGPFTPAYFDGTYAFTMGGSDNSGNPLAFGGLLPADGNGNTASGALDVNYSGNTSLGNSLSGPYTVDAAGRGVATLTSSVASIPVVLYKASNGTVQVVNIGGNVGGTPFVVSGMAEAQSGEPFGTRSVLGNYGINFNGTNFGSNFVGAGEEDISGVLTSDGGGNLTGTLDINNSGSIFTAVPLSASNYSMTSDGRGTASLNTGTGNFGMQTYQINPNTVLFLDSGANRVLTGIGQRQNF